VNIIDRMRERFQKRAEGAAEVEPGEFLTPVQMNRSQRRRLGWRGRVDPAWVQHETSTFVPRYVRRNHGKKRARAKIKRLMAGRMS
jgi:hypothetical protein